MLNRQTLRSRNTYLQLAVHTSDIHQMPHLFTVLVDFSQPSSLSLPIFQTKTRQAVFPMSPVYKGGAGNGPCNARNHALTDHICAKYQSLLSSSKRKHLNIPHGTESLHSGLLDESMTLRIILPTTSRSSQSPSTEISLLSTPWTKAMWSNAMCSTEMHHGARPLKKGDMAKQNWSFQYIIIAGREKGYPNCSQLRTTVKIN